MSGALLAKILKLDQAVAVYVIVAFFAEITSAFGQLLSNFGRA